MYVCTLADSLGRLNTIDLPPGSSQSYSLGFTPDMRCMAGTTVGAVQASCGILSHRRHLASARVTGKSLIGCRQPDIAAKNFIMLYSSVNKISHHGDVPHQNNF